MAALALRPYQDEAQNRALIRSAWEYRNDKLYWLINAGRGVSVKHPGDVVDTKPDPLGYGYVSWRRKHYAIHRVVFLLARGWLPDCIDHIDGDPQNNRIENLRPATRLQNQHNRRINTRTKSGHKNITQHQGKWCVRFSIARKTRHFGCFDTLEEACCTAARVRADLHKEFARHA
jgi:hypothetical protein